MKKICSLLKACMTDNMSLFRIKSKNKDGVSKFVAPIFLFLIIAFTFWTYADKVIDALEPTNSQHVVLLIFAVFTSVMTLAEGIYKSSSLLFECKDDNLLLSLPIKKSTVLFVRIFKFYIFEVVYNSMFLLPAMIVYAMRTSVNATYYFVSLLALLFLPIIPVVISCIIGIITTSFSSKFKYKNVAQIVFSMVFLLLVMYFSFNVESVMKNLELNANIVGNTLSSFYYPARAYMNMAIAFNFKELIKFVLINIGLLIAMIFAFSKIYFKINSGIKIRIGSSNKKYKVKTKSPMNSLIKKELNRFISSPVFVINAGLGLVLFVFFCILITLNFDNFALRLTENDSTFTVELFKSYIPAITFVFVCFSSLMTSITSSMISLEGKSFSILKTLPVKPFTIVLSKVYTALAIMLPFIFIGDLILFIKFKFTVLQTIMILLASIILPLVSELIGILVNLKYPKMDAQNDTEVVKQSMSSMIAVSTGIILSAITIYGVFQSFVYGFSNDLIIAVSLGFYILVCIILLIYLSKTSVRDFNNINV